MVMTSHPLSLSSTRRSVIGTAAAGTLAVALPASAETAEPAVRDRNPTLMWHAKPATAWEEGFPIGNGRLAAMLMGQVKRERVQLNEGTLFSGGPYDNVNLTARAALPQVRALIFAGRYAEAEALAEAHVQGTPMREMSYQSVGDLLLDLAGVNETAISDYRRELDLDAAIASTSFVSDGVRYRREAFASAVDGVIAVRITAQKPFALECQLISSQRNTASAPGSTTLLIEGVNNTDYGITGALRFAAAAEIVTDGGSVERAGPVVRIRDARAITVLVAAATSLRSPVDVSGDPVALVQRRLQAARSKTWDQLRTAHSADHRRLFRRLSIDLGTSEAAARPTDQRAAHALGQTDPALAALFVQFGRYLLIASSRGGEPANLQGKWNDSNRPPWGSKYTININTEMNYWPADIGNLAECVEPLTRMVEELAISGAYTASAMYGARGWVAHHNTDLWRASGPVDHSRTGLWPMGGAWLSCQLWDHWDYHRDPAFLRRIYPLLRGAALFFLDTLVEDPESGTMLTNPSLSPENDHGHGSTLCAGPAMDRQLLRDLFDRTIDAARRLRTDAELRHACAAMRGQLAPDRIGKAGQLQEWLLDWDADAREQTHRHTSHLYAVYPSGQINLDDTPALAAAACRSLTLRGTEATGWALAWRIALSARFRDAQNAELLVRRLLQSEPNANGMLGFHAPFQIDSFFGGTAGIFEMLVQSRGALIDLLPALPDSWPHGDLRGVRVRGGCTLDLAWQAGAPTRIILYPERSGMRTLRYGRRTVQVRLRAGVPRVLDPAALA
jgi:alpha-L-fucosidase 2